MRRLLGLALLGLALFGVVLGLLALVWHADDEGDAPPAVQRSATETTRGEGESNGRRRVEPPSTIPEAAETEAPRPEDPVVGRPGTTPVAWLIARQADDGSWDPEERDRVTRTELTATVALYLLALGPSERHDAALSHALAWLAARIDDSDGRVVDPAAGYDRRAHATAALALVEATAINPNLRRRFEPERAMTHLLRDIAGDEFRRVGADRTTEAEAATWAAMTLRSGALGGADVRPEQLARARTNLRGFFGNSTDVAYDDRSVAMLACADVLLGANPAADARLRRGIDALLERTAEGRLADPRLVYFGTLATFQAGGTAWDTWRTRLEAVPRPLETSSESASVHAVATRAMADAIVERWHLVHGSSR